MYGLKTALNRYHGNVSSSILLAMLCIAIRIVGAMWLISSCVSKGTILSATLGGVPGFCSGVSCTLGASA